MRHRKLSVTYRKQTLICLYEGTTTRRVNRRTKHFFQKKKKKRHPRGDKDRYNRYKNFPYPNFLLLVLKSFLPIYRQTDRSVCENYPYRFVFSPPLFIKNNLETRHLAIHFYPNVELRFVFSQILKRPSRLL